MSRRYYVADVVGDGSENDPYRSAVSDVLEEEGARASYEVNTDTMQSLAVVDVVNHAVIINTDGVDAMPDTPLDVKINSIRTATINGIETVLSNRGFSVDWSNSDAFRDMIRSVGKQINPNFDEDNFGPR